MDKRDLIRMVREGLVEAREELYKNIDQINRKLEELDEQERALSKKRHPAGKRIPPE